MKPPASVQPESDVLHCLPNVMNTPLPATQEQSPMTAIKTQQNQDENSTWDMSLERGDKNYRLLSLFVPISDVDSKAILQSSRGRERFFWAEPRNERGFLSIVGVGIAAEVCVAPVLNLEDYSSQLPGHRFQTVHEQASHLFQNSLFLSIYDTQNQTNIADHSSHPARPRLIGGFAFQDDFIPDNTWSVFNPAHFILPHFQWVSCDGEAFLTINALVPVGENVDESIKGLQEALQARMALMEYPQKRSNRMLDIRYPMTPDLWEKMLGNAIDEIKAGIMQKVVLSRVCEVVTRDPIDVAESYDYLHNNYGDCYRFIFEPAPYHAFYGATPELLVEKCGRAIKTMALAGSTARGMSPDEDQQKARTLLASDKEIHEHRLVVDSINNQLTHLVDKLIQPPEPSILRLKNIQHLFTPIAGELKDETAGILKLARLLHPTPAMGGVPVERALAFLRRAEPVPRGWYAAPIGWIDAKGDGSFAVAIRSAVTQHNRAWLYAGAGIVENSQPHREWAETSLKFRPMLGALGIENGI